MRRMENGNVQAMSLVNRTIDITMEGTYGYTTRAFREGGGALLTATSTVEEFYVEAMEEREHHSLGKVFCFIGTDYYHRKMELPIQRVRAVREKDTDEQYRLVLLQNMYGAFEEMKDQVTAVGKTVKEVYDGILGPGKWDEVETEYKALIDAGVTKYEPKRATEDEL